MSVVSLASPLLKCVLPESPALDTRVQHDVFGSPYTFEDQPRLTRRAFEIAERVGAGIVRVFSYWRTVEPERTFDRVATALRDARGRGRRSAASSIGLENEHACNVGTGAEAARLLAAVEHPARASWCGIRRTRRFSARRRFRTATSCLPPDRIGHVHAKDCHVKDHKPTWGPVGEMGIDWRGQIAALERDGYKGWISLETHWTGPG